jgi:hypothetical protein
MEEIFDYKLEMSKARARLWGRIAAYVLGHPRERVPEIAPKFNVSHNIVEKAAARNGAKRRPGRKSWHFPSTRTLDR